MLRDRSFEIDLLAELIAEHCEERMIADGMEVDEQGWYDTAIELWDNRPKGLTTASEVFAYNYPEA